MQRMVAHAYHSVGAQSQLLLCPLQLMRPQPTVSEQECTRCHLTKPAADFYYVPTAAKGLKKQCKACMLVRCLHPTFFPAAFAMKLKRDLFELNKWLVRVHEQYRCGMALLLPGLLPGRDALVSSTDPSVVRSAITSLPCRQPGTGTGT